MENGANSMSASKMHSDLPAYYSLSLVSLSCTPQSSYLCHKTTELLRAQIGCCAQVSAVNEPGVGQDSYFISYSS